MAAGLGHELQAVYLVWFRDLKRFWRDKPQLAGTTFRSVLWLVFLGFGIQGGYPPVQGYRYTQFVLPGIMGMAVLFTSIQSTITIIWDREFGFMKEMLVAPISRFSIVAGKALSGTTLGLFEAGIVLALAPLFGLPVSPGAALRAGGVLFLMGLGFSGLGIAIASRLRTFEGFGAIMNFLVLPVFFLSGALYPVDRLPGPLLFLVELNPMSYAVDWLRLVLLGLARFGTGHSFSVLGFFALVTMSSAVRSFYVLD